MIALVSSLLSHPISIITQSVYVYALDIPLNMLCVILTAQFYNKLYRKLCCGAIKCFERIWHNEEDDGPELRGHVSVALSSTPVTMNTLTSRSSDDNATLPMKALPSETVCTPISEENNNKQIDGIDSEDPYGSI